MCKTMRCGQSCGFVVIAKDVNSEQYDGLRHEKVHQPA